MPCHGPKQRLFSETPDAVADGLIAKLTDFPAITAFQPGHNPAYLYVDSTYIHTKEDFANPVLTQGWAVLRCKTAGANIKQEYLESGDHMCWYSCPDETAAVVDKTLASVMAKKGEAVGDFSATWQVQEQQHKEMVAKMMQLFVK